MTPIETPGGWYIDALPDGTYVELVTNSHLNTSRGRVELPSKQNALFVTLAPDGSRFAGVGHGGSVKDQALEWTGVTWEPHGLAVGTQPVIYDNAGVLHVSNGSIGAQGWRQVADDGHLVTGDASTADIARRIWNYTTHGNWTIGQGGAGPDGDDPLIALYLGRRILLQRGRCRAVRFRLAGDRVALAWVQEDRGRACRWFGTVAQLLAEPDQVTSETPPPHVDPPAVTILFYPTSVHLGDPARCLANVTGGPAERLIWLFRKADAADWQIAAVNIPADSDHTYVFQSAGDWEIGARVEGPGGVNQTATRRVVHVEADVPTDPPQRSDRFWFGPNIKSADLVQLFSESDRWAAARARLGVFQFYGQQITSYVPAVGANTYEALVAVDAFRKLTAWGIPICIETGAVKEGDCDAAGHLHELPTIVQRIRDAGGTVAYVAMDEPLTGAKKCPNTLEQTADAVAAFIAVGESLGVPVGWIEAWPEIDLETQRRFLTLLDWRGHLPSFWRLDIDRRRAQKERRSIADFLAGERSVRTIAGKYAMPVGVILTGYDYATDAEYAADVRAWASEVHGILPDLEQVVVQSWSYREPARVQDLPRNLSEAQADTHTAVLTSVGEMFS